MNKDDKLKIDIADSPKHPDQVDDTALDGAILPTSLAKEINGPKGLEPTRYGDWEAKGRCYDF